MNLRPGTELDGYRILAAVGAGTCGTVYQAENLVSGGIFALKVLPLQGGLPEREMQALRLYRSIEHPNLIRIHHAARSGGWFYYTMDWCEATLAARRVSPAELLGIARSLAGALAELHVRGLVHRDIKPDNIFFRQGVPVLGDIGLVVSQDAATFAGSPGFLAPALLRGEIRPCPETDCYALAKSLYCALSGESPAQFPLYAGPLTEDAARLMRAALAACGDPPTVRSADELLAVLDAPAAPPKRRFRRVYFALPAAALLALGAWFLLRPSAETPEPAKPAAEPVKPAVEPVKPVAEPVKPVAEPVKPVAEPVKTSIPKRSLASEWAGRLQAQSAMTDRLLATGVEDAEVEKALCDPTQLRKWRKICWNWRTTERMRWASRILDESRASGEDPEAVLTRHSEKDARLRFFVFARPEYVAAEKRLREAAGDARPAAEAAFRQAERRYIAVQSQMLENTP